MQRYASAVYAMALCPSVRPPVCLYVHHKSVLYRNDQTDRAGFWHGSYPKLCYKEIWIPPKILVLPAGTLPHILDLEYFATASRRCGQQDSSTVEPVDYTYDDRARRGWMHSVYYTLVSCNRLTPLLRFVLN